MKRIISILVAVSVLSLVLAVPSEGKLIKEYVGKLMCTTYHVSDNTPPGRETSTGHRATEYHTIAVDAYNPRFKMGQKLHVEGFGEGVVEDVGGFAKHGADLDLFTPENDDYKKYCKVWQYRPETPEEIEARLAKERKELQNETFIIIHSDRLKAGEAITDQNYIKSETLLIGYTFLEVVKHKSGSTHTIYVGNKVPFGKLKVKLSGVWEGAVG